MLNVIDYWPMEVCAFSVHDVQQQVQFRPLFKDAKGQGILALDLVPTPDEAHFFPTVQAKVLVLSAACSAHLHDPGEAWEDRTRTRCAGSPCAWSTSSAEGLHHSADAAEEEGTREE